ncbi:ABC transporter substrate binding protein [Massilia sp. W12]|uniref:ABC transporter substrate binding protein n=1 Tax=Massilia sp. W12 TaxID=3126507 RepID=UPI0030D358AC
MIGELVSMKQWTRRGRSCASRALHAALLLCLMFFCCQALAQKAMQNHGIVILYPDIADPYRSVFVRIIDGIEEKLQSKAPQMAVSSNANPADVNEFLQKQNAKLVIALGRQGLRQARQLNKDYAVLVGGVLVGNEAEVKNLTVHSLAPDPALLFLRLKSLSPNAKRITVIYDPKQNDWLIKLARTAARAQGMELHAVEAADLKSAVSRYQEFFSTAESGRDALWLPHDNTTVQESAILPLVLRSAWDKSLAVFSSTLSHVEKGILFSLYPDNQEIGRSLALAARNRLSNPGKDQILPTREVLSALNTSTASHLGISITNRRQQFDMLFPEQ